MWLFHHLTNTFINILFIGLTVVYFTESQVLFLEELELTQGHIELSY